MAAETIEIVHTNDLHSHLENWPRIRRYIQAVQATESQAGQTVLVFDIGDAEDRAHPLTEATNGEANVALLNQIGYDAVTIGNNEGIGNSHAQLEHLYDHANFDVVLANLFEKDGSRPKFAQPYKQMTTKQGTRVTIIGLTAPFFLTYQPNGWQPRVVQDVLPDILAQTRASTDIFVVLSHLGIEMDRYLAKHFPELAVVLGSHTHHLLPHGEQHGHTMLGAAGKYGQYIGKMTLNLDAQHHIIQTVATVQKTSELPEEPEDKTEIQDYAHRGHALLRQVKIANIPEPLVTAIDRPTNMIHLALKALRVKGQTEVAILNQGLFLRDLKAGIVTMDDLHDQMPHPMHLLRVTLRGYDLWRLVMEMEKNRLFLRHFPIKGMSFRGKLFGELVYDGLTIEPGTRRVLWHGSELNPEQTYTITVLDHYLFIPFFPTIEIVGENEFLFPEFLRNVVADYLQQHYPV
ncbi:bifunctional metallophosphatase/5'-nucleotidase [Agrilactobacillus fermenti]|uniref:bifunctional metallophosphatase/5'-nucleotidase n=1 Tax=Agrilactobacillus fermenti TaxID=2586909 RepID=UPI003A5C3347